MTTLIFGILIGACFVLTVENTILIHMKPKKKDEPEEMTEEQKRREEEFDALMNFRGRKHD